MNPWVYAVLCVTVPLAWGLVVVWATGLVERRIGKRPEEIPPIAQDDWVI